MDKKKIGLTIIPVIGLIFILATSDSETQDMSEDVDVETSLDSIIPDSPSLVSSNPLCSGSAKCFSGTVTKIIDGDTIHVDNQSVRFALASAPELKGFDGADSKEFIQTICPVGSEALVDEDDGQIPEGHSRIIGVVHCNDMILNQELLDSGLGYLDSRFCSSSEFGSDSWAQKHGCVIESDS